MKLWGDTKTGYRRVEQLRKFLRFGDPEETRRRKREDVFADARPLMDSLLYACENTFDVGRDTSLDEVDVGSQCKFAGKDTIKYKAEGDGFLLDAVCDSTSDVMITFRARKDTVESL